MHHVPRSSLGALECVRSVVCIVMDPSRGHARSAIAVAALTNANGSSTLQPDRPAHELVWYTARASVHHMDCTRSSPSSPPWLLAPQERAIAPPACPLPKCCTFPPACPRALCLRRLAGLQDFSKDALSCLSNTLSPHAAHQVLLSSVNFLSSPGYVGLLCSTLLDSSTISS